MQGQYKIFVDGELLYIKNIITAEGRLAAINAIAGKRTGFAESIVVGIGSTAATADDKTLEFLVAGSSISTIITDPVNERIYFKSVLPAGDQYKIYELGCYSSGINAALQTGVSTGVLLNNFNGATTWTDVSGTHTLSAVNSRLDSDSIEYAITASGTVKGYATSAIDLSSLPDSTEFSLAYYVNNLADLIIRFKTDDTNYYSYNGLVVSNGYKIDKFLKSDFSATGSPNWASIVAIEIEATATGSPGTISLDGLRYDIVQAAGSGLVSRAVLSSPMEKLSGITMDIEYVLELDI